MGTKPSGKFRLNGTEIQIKKRLRAFCADPRVNSEYFPLVSGHHGKPFTAEELANLLFHLAQTAGKQKQDPDFTELLHKVNQDIVIAVLLDDSILREQTEIAYREKRLRDRRESQGK